MSRKYTTRTRRPPFLILTCQQCGQPFHVPPSTVARGSGKYCSNACAGNARSERASTPERNAERFWKNVDKTDGDGCWVWTAYRHTIGYPYGKFMRYISKSAWRSVQAHRFSYELHYGPIPDGLEVLHRCDNPPCVRPDHLFLGTQADNIADMLAKGRGSPPPNRWKLRTS